jgi:hypothetical protein
VRVIYIPAKAIWAAWRGELLVKGLEPGVDYHTTLFDPKTGQEHELGVVRGDENGDWVAPKPPVFQDYVLVLERWAESAS